MPHGAVSVEVGRGTGLSSPSSEEGPDYLRSGAQHRPAYLEAGSQSGTCPGAREQRTVCYVSTRELLSTGDRKVDDDR